MKRTAFILMCMCTAASYGVVIYDNPAGGTIWAWNWGDNGMGHTAAEVNYGGNIVIQHTGVVNNTTGGNVNYRYGSKWDITVSGNSSADPADYTIAFDLRNVSGSWDPIPLNLAVLTKESGGDQGHGYATMNVAQAAGWVHYEFNLANWANNWWQGAAWNLTNPSWSLEVGMPWPGISTPNGTSFTQIWEMDNLKITMIPEPASLILLGLGALSVVKKRN